MKVTQVIHTIDGRGYDLYYIAWYDKVEAKRQSEKSEGR